MSARVASDRHSIIIDLDATDDATHGQQLLSFYHGHYRQHQYFPLLAFDSRTGFPLAAWLRPGTVHASSRAIDTVREIVAQLRKAWPDVAIFVRGDGGFAVPAMYEYCEQEGLFYAFGYSTNNTLKQRTDEMLSKTIREFENGEAVQRFQAFDDYQAGTWSRARQILAKVEVNRQGTNRRFVVTNMSGDPQGLYHGFYVKRGNVPEKPLGELKNGLNADRLSSHGFTADAHPIRHAGVGVRNLRAPPRGHSRGTGDRPQPCWARVRLKLFKIGAVVKTSVRRIWFHLSETWPHRVMLVRVQQALHKFVAAVMEARSAPLALASSLLF